MIYFDTEHEAYQQRETIEKWGKTYLTECTEEEYLELQEGKKMWDNGKIVVNPNYEEEQKQKEHERIGELELTSADVERAIYEAKGMDFNDLIEFVINSELVGFDVKRLKIELGANHFIRKHPYINMIGEMLGYSSDDMDYLFENKMFPIKKE